MNGARILVVEDEEHLASGLRFNLEAEGYLVEIASDGLMALERLLGVGDGFDVVILDVMLPGKDGFEVATELRAAGKYVPVLMLTARGRPEDVLQGFEAGADDYLPKPFELSILLARLHGLLRRREWFGQSQQQQQEQEEVNAKTELYSFDGKTVDFVAQELRAHGRVVQLTLMEAELLRYLIGHAGRPVSRKEILEDVWNLHVDTDTRAIDNFIVRLRRYVEEDPAKPRHLLTVRSIGYRFIPEPES
ncbi:MAG TPA: response regulator transcription factor [Pyrinomonadaceae bacterium]|jgi:DNA-binding response OmpR family regulator|nr:response regulator transcription factor [Pyrinomonadaceae bacterium]